MIVSVYQKNMLHSVKRSMSAQLGIMRIISPIDSLWDSFFQPDESLKPTDDFMQSRASQTQADRERFE